MTTSYDHVPYPAGIFPQTQPARLAVLAALHGLAPAAPATARVLEVGCGSASNLIALAAAWPRARFAGFDLAPSAITAGQALADAAGLTNITLFAGDIVEVARTIEPGAWDYVIAHGVYAWVPAPVREALLALFARALAPGGVAFVSYNALPGGYVRMIMRDRLLHALSGVDDPRERIAAAGTILQAMAEDAAGEGVEGGAAVNALLREHARSMLERPAAVVFHDELGPVFAPQRLTDLAADAARHGFAWLSDAGRNRNLDGFLPPDWPAVADEDSEALRLGQAGDNEAVRFFRQSVLVRAGSRPERRITPAVTGRVGEMWLSANLTPLGEGRYRHAKDEIAVPHSELAAALDAAIAAYPAAVRVGDVLHSHEARGGLLRLFAEWYLELRHDPPPFATRLPACPAVSPLVRASLRLDHPMVLALDHTMVTLSQPWLRRLLIAADGTRDGAGLAAAVPEAPPAEIPAALADAVRRAMVVPG